MHFSVGVAIFLICSTLLEALPTPQIKSIPKQPWRPKAIREKEAAEAAARAAEEVARAAAEEAARASTEGTIEVAEDVTEIVKEAITALNEIMEVTTISAETVADNENDSLTVTEEPFDSNSIISITSTTQKNIVESSPLPTMKIAITSYDTSEKKSSRKLLLSTSEKPRVFTTQKTEAHILGVGEQTVCRLSLRGKPCACRFEKTCRCDCGRITAINQDSASNPEKPSRIRSHRIRFSKLNKPSKF